MSLIKRAAYALFCPKCGCHARIVCANGKKGKEFATKAGGQESLAALVLSGDIAEDEVPEVRRQIVESDLALQDAEVEDLFRRYFRARLKLGELLDSFHEEIASCWVDEDERDGHTRKPQERKTLH